jgi:hypothetical protein
MDIMSDWKSKLPDLKEVASMSTKLAQDIKKSITEIFHEYKQKHPDAPEHEKKAADKDKADHKEEHKAEHKEEPKAEHKKEPKEEPKAGKKEEK